ncbi:hypothetical protein EJB05_04075, partial [Eragrostis curvula]
MLQLNISHDGDCVCLCTPATRASSRSNSLWTWRMKALQRFPKPPLFCVDETFSLRGKAFWADILKGVFYCNLLDEASVVDFHFIKLPNGYVIDDVDFNRTEQRMSRTIGCAGSSIKIVCIDRRRGYETVHVWTLDLQRRRWKRDQGFPCPWNEFRKRIGFMNAAELRDMEPRYPTLMPDGELCLMLRWRDWVRAREETGYACSFDMGSKSTVWFGHYHKFTTTLPLSLIYCLAIS